MHSNFRLTFAAALLACTALVGAPARAEVPSQFVNAQTGTTYTVLQTDCSKLVTFSNTAAVAVTLPQAGTSGKFFNGCFFDFENKGAGTVTITPTTSTINGRTTLVLATNRGAHVVSDSTNYQVQLGVADTMGVAKCTSTAASPECSAPFGKVTTASLVLASTAGVSTIQVFTNSFVTTLSIVLCTLANYTGTLATGLPALLTCTPGNATITAAMANVGSGALNGNVDIQFAVISK